MRLAAITLVRDQTDIIESFVRHNAAFLDRLYVVDHRSMDSSGEILNRLAAEGLPLVLERSDAAAFYQAAMTNALIQRAIADETWDFIFPIDCDEFLRLPDRATLEAILAGATDESVGLANYAHYISTASDDPAEPDPIRRLQYCAEVRPKQKAKLVIPGRLAALPDFRVDDGNHVATIGKRRLEPWRSIELDLAHYPVRNAEQFVAKTLHACVAWFSREDYKPYWNTQAFKFYEELKANPHPTSEDLTRAGLHYVTVNEWGEKPKSVTVVHAPLVPAYDRLRYAHLADCRSWPNSFETTDRLLQEVRNRRERENSRIAAE